MASFLSNMFPSQSAKEGKSPASERPGTPTKNCFLTPVATPQGSPSKKTIPPGANELSSTFENALKLNPVSLDSPAVKLGRPQSGTPLSPTKSNAQPIEDGYFTSASSPVVDNSIIHKSGDTAGTPLKRQGQENTPPSRIPVRDSVYQHNQAALSRQELYLRDSRPVTPATPTTKKFNTSRGLTPEELEILKKPNVRRLVNVTQLCKTFGLN